MGRKVSDETRRKISNSLKGEKHFNYGKHYSDEEKFKLSIAQKRAWEKRRKICLVG